MPTYEIKSPDGRTFEVRAASPEAAAKAVQNLAPTKPDAPGKAYSGAILPFSKDAEGNVSFDSDAGIVGAIKRAVTLPGDVYAGRVDPRSDEAVGRAFELAAMGSPINPAMRAGDMVIPGMKQALAPKPVKPPSAEALKKAGSRGYDAVRDMGVDYRSDAVRDLAGTVRAELEQDGISGELAPKTFSILAKLENPPAGSVAPLSGLEAARRTFRNAAKDFNNPTEQLAAERAMGRLEGFVQAGDPASLMARPAAAEGGEFFLNGSGRAAQTVSPADVAAAKEAGRKLAEARANYAAGKRSDLLKGRSDSAELKAVVANSGQNIDNRIRSVAEWVVDPTHKERRAGFSKGELKLIEGVARGNFGRNTLRYVGNLLGGGGGLGTAFVGSAGALTGASLGGPMGLAAGIGLPAVGFAAKKTGNALTRRALRKADEAVRKNSPVYERMLQESPLEAPNALKRAALLRALLLSQGGGQPPRA